MLKRLIGIALFIAFGAAVYLWLKPVPKPKVVQAVSNPMGAEVAASIPAPAPAIRYPLAAAEPLSSTPAVSRLKTDPKTEFSSALADLIGRKAMLVFLAPGDFIHQFVATVDNLGRDQAPSLVWPLRPTLGKTQVIERQGGSFLAPTNAKRYEPFVRLAVSVDAAQAVKLYRSFYPLFQQAYEDLGYPGKYFNDRLVDVIDQLMATPDLPDPIMVTLTQVNGPVPSLRPWVRYEFADTALEARPAGQKILLRMGQINARLLKEKLSEFRATLASGRR